MLITAKIFFRLFQDLTIAKELGDRAGEDRAYGNLGSAHRRLCNFKQAIEYHNQDLTIAKELGDRAVQGGAYGNLGLLYRNLGNFKQAIEYHNQDLTLSSLPGILRTNLMTSSQLAR